MCSIRGELPKSVAARGLASALVCIGLWCLLPTPFAVAQFGGEWEFDTSSARGRDVLQVSCVLQCTEAATFSNVEVTINTAKGPSAADRDLTIAVYCQPLAYSPGPHAVYRAQVQLAEGASQAQVNIPFAQAVNESFAWEVVVYEDGRDLKNRAGLPANAATYTYTSVESKPGFYSIAELLGSTETTRDKNSELRVISGALQPIARFDQTQLRDASDDWRMYLVYDALVVSAQTMNELVEQEPKTLAAIRDYVAAGGKIIIHSAQHTLTYAEIDKSLFLDSHHADAWESIKHPRTAWWKESLDPQSQGRRSLTPQSLPPLVDNVGVQLSGIRWDAFLAAETWTKLQWGNHADNAKGLVEFLGTNVLFPYWIDGFRQGLAAELESKSIQKRSYLNGSVLVAETPLSQVPSPLLSFTLQSQLDARLLDQLSSSADSDWTWRNMVESVGKTPVWAFCGIITLFAALLGPGLLYFTGRIRRRSMMIFLVPVLSSIATLSIVLYGVIHEGFDTYIRVASVQFINPQSESGFAWSRQNYFSGWPPADGLEFNPNTYVRPVTSESFRKQTGEPSKGADVSVDLGEKQRWYGWLKPRQQQQLLVGHPIANVQSPIAVELAKEPELIRVTNVGSVMLPLVVIRGAADDYFYATMLDAGDSIVLTPGDRDAVGTNVGRIFQAYKPESPLRGFVRQMGITARARSMRSTGDTSDIFAMTYNRCFSDSMQLPKFGFALVQTESNHIEKPLPGEIEDGIHVISGVLSW